jgi:8-oxo-dGTP pyrophosphatase MutT (NUDIX family)
MPEFPKREEISIEAYFAVFDQYQNFFGDDCAVIAHSIGNGMLLKYLAATGKRLNRYISLAGFAVPFVVEGKDVLNEKLALLKLSEAELRNAREAIFESFCVYSNNDHLVPFEALYDYPKLIDGEGILVENIGHMGHKAGITEIPGVVELATGRTEFEFSAGCIIIDGVKILLEKEISRNGDRFWAFPKGHQEAGETDVQTALRETKEEVGLDVEIIDEKPIDNNYFLHGGKVLKQVSFYLAKPVGNTEPTLQAEEVEQARWMSFDEARELADFEYTKITIDEVKERIAK